MDFSKISSSFSCSSGAEERKSHNVCELVRVFGELELLLKEGAHYMYRLCFSKHTSLILSSSQTVKQARIFEFVAILIEAFVDYKNNIGFPLIFILNTHIKVWQLTPASKDIEYPNEVLMKITIILHFEDCSIFATE